MDEITTIGLDIAKNFSCTDIARRAEIDLVFAKSRSENDKLQSLANSPTEILILMDPRSNNTGVEFNQRVGNMSILSPVLNLFFQMARIARSGRLGLV